MGRDSTRPPLVCGIDLGSRSTLSYVAWLDGNRLVFDVYQASAERPLPEPPGQRRVAAYAIDAPQGLPAAAAGGRSRRVADAEAHTPTQSLPTDRAGLLALRLYGGLVRTGVEVFWSIHTRGLGHIVGSDEPAAPADDRPLVGETWPRLVLRRLRASARGEPPKRREPEAYARLVWQVVRATGLHAASVRTPAVDHAEAALAALAARALADAARRDSLPFHLGIAPQADAHEGLLREGFIVSC